MQEVKIEGFSSDGENVCPLTLNTIKKEPCFHIDNQENQEHCVLIERKEAEEEEVSINQFEKNLIEYERDSIKREPEPELIINDLENAFDFEPDDPNDANFESESISRRNVHAKPTIESTNEIKTKAKREYKRPHKHKCLLCSKCFTGFKKMSIHMRKHTREKPYFCKKCPKSFVEPYTFRRHKYLHKDKNKMPFPCTETECLKTFAHKGHLNQHLLVSHSSHFIPFTCSICKMTYTQKSKLKKHEETHTSSYHQDNNKPAKCPKPKRKRREKTHKNSYQDNKPAKCSVCSVMFKNSLSLSIHRRMHKESLNLPYKCTFCKNSYSSKGYFQLHLRKHTDKKAHTCTICSKDFANNSSLTRHSVFVHKKNKDTNNVMKCHEKVLKCPNCPKTFSQADYLKSHVRVHSTVKEFSCPFCTAKYRHRPNLNGHLRKKH